MKKERQMTATRKRAETSLPLIEFDYPWIRAWGAYTDATRPMIEEMLALARAEAVADTALWWYPDEEVPDPYWSDDADRWVPTRTIPAHWEYLTDLMHGRQRRPQITDQRIFLWDWGMHRQIHVPDEILRAWLGEVIIEDSLGR
jgi:hypothetical protein